jgi:hypothetical protein
MLRFYFRKFMSEESLLSAPREPLQTKRAGASEAPSVDHVVPPLYVWLIVLLLLVGTGTVVIGFLLLRRVSPSLLSGLPVDQALARLTG